MKKYMEEPVYFTNDRSYTVEEFFDKMILDDTGIGDTEPDFDKMDEMELYSYLEDYSNYVQEMCKKGKMPETVFDFFDRWCAITRGPLCHTLIGATVFVNKKPGVFEPKIVKTIIVNDDYSVAVEFEDGDTSYSGCIYSKPKAYEL